MLKKVSRELVLLPICVSSGLFNSPGDLYIALQTKYAHFILYFIHIRSMFHSMVEF